MHSVGQFEILKDRFLLLEDLQLSHGISFSLPSHRSSLRNLKSLSLTDYRVANLSGLNKLTSLTVRRVISLLGKEEIFPNLTKLKGDAYFLKDGINQFSQLNEFFGDYLPHCCSTQSVFTISSCSYAALYTSTQTI
jgi:hypothetical protein